MKSEDVLVTLDLVILALGVGPELFDKISALRERAKNGEEASPEELRSLIGGLKDRSSRIQAA